MLLFIELTARNPSRASRSGHETPFYSFLRLQQRKCAVQHHKIRCVVERDNILVSSFWRTEKNGNKNVMYILARHMLLYYIIDFSRMAQELRPTLLLHSASEPGSFVVANLSTIVCRFFDRVDTILPKRQKKSTYGCTPTLFEHTQSKYLLNTFSYMNS